MNADTPRLVVFTESDEGPVCGLDEETIRAAGGALRMSTAYDESERTLMAEDAEVLIVSSAPITREFLGELPKLKGLVRLGIGVDTVDVDAATDLGIVVANVLNFCQEEVAEHALALIFAVARKIVLADRKTRNGEWVAGVQESMLPIRRLKGQTLGLIGFGSIARSLAARAKALGLEVIAADPYAPPDAAKALGVQMMHLAELLSNADIISLHVPLTPETRHLIDAEAISLVKDTAILINTSRGSVVDEAALRSALTQGRLAGAGLDVLEEEPIQLPHPLLHFDNVIVTCHYASCSLEAYAEMRRAVSDQTAQILRGEFPQYLVNVQVKDRPQCRLRTIKPQS